MGGKRLGAGRKPNSKDKVPRAQKRNIAELAQRYTDEALAVLVKVMKDAELPAAARVTAANSILDRGHGKATQHVEYEIDPSKLTDEQLLAFAAALATAGHSPAAIAQSLGGDRASSRPN